MSWFWHFAVFQVLSCLVFHDIKLYCILCKIAYIFGARHINLSHLIFLYMPVHQIFPSSQKCNECGNYYFETQKLLISKTFYGIEYSQFILNISSLYHKYNRPYTSFRPCRLLPLSNKP